jgi:hypothetical protein
MNQHDVIGHKARREALLKLVQALCGGAKLSLTQLGRHRAGGAYPKHHIKAADRLLMVRVGQSARLGLDRQDSQRDQILPRGYGLLATYQRPAHSGDGEGPASG